LKALPSQVVAIWSMSASLEGLILVLRQLESLRVALIWLKCASQLLMKGILSAEMSM